MNRRDAVVALIALGAAPLASLAQQQGKVWRVGFLALRPVDSLDSDYYGGFSQGMRELGYVEGKNLVIEWRSADNRSERLPGLAAELVRLKVDVILAAGAQSVGAAQKATTTIPIVMGSINDPVGGRFIQSLARPGGNITGLSNISVDLAAKHVELLLSIVPRASRIAVLVNLSNSGHPKNLDNIRAAAKGAGVTIVPLDVRSPQEIEKAFSSMIRESAAAVIVTSDAFLNSQSRRIAELAARNRLPAIGSLVEYAEAGGLMSYGQNRTELYRHAASYVDKIFKGAKPADLPVEQPVKLELVINLKTAKAVGVTIPTSVLLRADRVIE